MHSHPLRGAGSAVLLGVLMAAVPSWADASDADAVAPLSPDAAVAAALSLHPAVREAESALLLARGFRSESSFLLNNPDLSAGASLDGTRAGFELVQPLSLTGESWYARGAASARVEAAQASLDRTRLATASETRLTYVDAVAAAGRVRVAREGVELAERLRRAVTHQGEEGEASTLDLRLARLAEVQAAAGLMEALDTEAGSLRDLAERIGQAVSSGVLVPNPLAAAPEPTTETDRERSDVVAVRSELRAAEAELRRQRAATMPPVGIGVFVDVEDGQTYVGPSLGVTLPLFARNQAGRAGAHGDLLVAEARVASTTALAETEVATARSRVAEASELSLLLGEDPVEEARAALASIEAGYLAGEIDLPSTVLLQGEVLDGEAAVIDLLGRVASARLDLLLATEDPALLGGAR